MSESTGNYLFFIGGMCAALLICLIIVRQELSGSGLISKNTNRTEIGSLWSRRDKNQATLSIETESLKMDFMLSDDQIKLLAAELAVAMTFMEKK